MLYSDQKILFISVFECVVIEFKSQGLKKK